MNIPILPPPAPQSRQLSMWIATTFTVVTALGFLVTAIWFVITLFCFFNAQEQRDSWVPAVGKVTEWVPSASDEHAMYLQYTFTAQDGNTYTVKSDIAVRPPRHQIGDEVEMLYPADNPAEAVEKGGSHSLATLFGIITLFWFLISLGLLFITRVIRKKTCAQS